MKLRRRSGISALLASGLLLSLLAPIAGAQERPADREERIRSGIDQAIARVQDELLEQVEEAPSDETLLVVVRMEEGTDLSAFTEGAPLVRPAIESLGTTAAVARVKAANVVKLASVEGVQFVQLPESMATPPEPPDPDVGTYAPSFDLFVERLRGIYGEGAPQADDGGAGAEPTGWFDVREDAGHRSAAAWDKGYTGDGVKVMVNDSGIDFAHPDLQGTWATVPNGPLAGWPLMFDSYSLFVYVLDNFSGTTSVADGQTDYVDTSHECSRPGRGATVRCPFTPLGGRNHTYTVPNTSESGVYRLGSHPDKTLATFWAQILSPGPQVNAGERAAILLVDENEAGVYDTVYVDLNYNFDFTDEKPATKEDPVLYRDGMTIHLPPAGGGGRGEPTTIEVPADGYADISGGLVYFIADGSTDLPGWYLWGPSFAPAPANGDLVAFALNDPLEAAGDHGQLTASNVAAQGVINGAFGAAAERPAYKPADAGGMVQGAGKDAKLVNNGNFYLSPFLEDGMLFSALGYDGVAGTEDDTQIVSNSWGCSAVDNDGWDTACGSRLFELIMEFISDGTMTTTISTGNGGPGYGTISPPGAPSQISVGASTQMGSTGWDSAEDLDQITWGDIIPFSNRGPSALGDMGTHVVADGAYASGALALNEWGDGWTAYTTWGGTSRSAPVAAGNLALVYDAFHQANGDWPTRHEARAIFMHGADNIHYDVLTQGGGLVNADRATDIAAGDGFFVTPDNWQVGDYRGNEFPGFANIIAPGGSDSQTFNVTGPGPVDLSAVTLSKIGEVEFDLTSTAQGAEDPYNFDRPGYLREITDDIPEGTDLMVVRAIYPYDQWDVNQDYVQDNVWRLLAYDWTDQDGDGALWTDDGNGTVNGEELDEGEYMRYAYHHTGQNNKHVFVHDPHERRHDGIFIGLQHQVRNGPSQTDFSFRVEFYAEEEFDWISVPGSASGSFEAVVNVPDEAPLGLHQAAILVDDGTHESVIPVVIDVAADSASFAFGGQEPTGQLYDNSLTYGMQDWTWRAESGDWRFFFTDLPDLEVGEEDSQTVLLVDTEWENGPFTDIDTIVMGPTADDFSPSGHFGPYTLETIGKSQNTNIGAGTWTFHTATGGAREIVSVPYVPGLNLVALHTVNYQGDSITETVSGQVGTIEVSPAAITSDSATGTQTVSVTPSVDLSGLVAEGFGLSQPETTTGTVNQDDPDDPSTASFSQTVDISHGASLDVFIDGAAGDDLDLYVYRPDGTLAGSSTTPTADEFVTVQFPEDGTWRIDVHGWSVPAGSTSFELTVDAIQGTQVTTSDVEPPGPVAAGSTATFDVTWDGTGLAAGTYDGLVFLGPPEAPGAVRLPVTITVP